MQAIGNRIRRSQGCRLPLRREESFSGRGALPKDRMIRRDAPKQRILKILNLEDTPLEHPAPSRLRDREAIAPVITPVSVPGLTRRPLLRQKKLVLKRLPALVATATLAGAVLFRPSFDYRTAVCIVVSMATTALAVRSLFLGKVAWAVVFVGVLGLFTPFQRLQSSQWLLSILDMAAMALFAASPLIFRRSITPEVLHAPSGRF